MPLVREWASSVQEWKDQDAFTPTKADWYKDARFGMFIHWGLYSQAGGEWKGERYYGITEWLMKRSEESTEDYSKLAAEFNPTAFDAKAWVTLAKDAGMKYIVITSKHHDSFALFDSAASDFDIIDATPFGRDPLKELADEAAVQGIKLGFYYSQYQDWTDPNAGGNDWEFDKADQDYEIYRHGKALPQIKELLTNYGDVGIVWFDTPGNTSKADAEAFVDFVEALQPKALISSRVGHGLGDFKTMRDAELPTRPIKDRPWEAIFTHNDSWGYSAFDTNFKSTTELLKKLSYVASKGGNLMVNIGPDGSGRLPEGSTRRFKKVGDWLEKNGEAIYGTHGSPLGDMPWGAITYRPGALYFHVYNKPKDGILVIPNMSATARSARFLDGFEEIPWTMRGGDLYIPLPDKLPDDRNTIVKFSFVGDLKTVGDGLPTQVSLNYHETILSPATAQYKGSAKAARLRNGHYFGDWKYADSFRGLDSPGDAAIWPLRVMEPGEYRISATYAANADSAGQEGLLEVASQTIQFRVLRTSERTGKYELCDPLPTIDHDLGLVRFSKAGEYSLVLKPRADGDNLFTLTELKLQPVD
ncbi:MAG: alpha-L-fucosidase [Litorimonas sp.]